MIEKHKELSKYIIFIIAYILFCIMLCVLVDVRSVAGGESDYFYYVGSTKYFGPKDWEAFLNADPAELVKSRVVRKKGDYIDTLYGYDQGACFHHVADGWDESIEAVIDVRYNETNKRMEMMSYGKNGEKIKATVDDTDLVGTLGGSMSKKNNIRGVYLAARNFAESSKGNLIYKADAFASSSDLFSYYGVEGNGTNSEVSEYIENYQSFRGIKKDESVTPKDQRKTVQLTRNDGSDVTCSIIGPFKVSYAGKNIEMIEVTSGGNRLTWISGREKEAQGLIFKCFADGRDVLDSRNWDRIFNATDNNVKNKSFYLAVPSSFLPSSNEKFNVKMTQGEFIYRDTRLIVTNGSSQEQGMYDFSTDRKKAEEVDWDLTRNAESSLTLKKVDESTGKDVNAKFYIYYKGDKSQGWIKSISDGKLNLLKNSTNSYKGNKFITDYLEKNKAQLYKSGDVLNKIPNGSYYVFETQVEAGYILNRQPGYQKYPNTSEVKISGVNENIAKFDYVYVGKSVINNDNRNVIHRATNVKTENSLTIKKIKKGSSPEVTVNAEFFIYYYKDKNNKNNGWVKYENGKMSTVALDKDYTGKANDFKNFLNKKATKFKTGDVLDNIYEGEYYVFETAVKTEGFVLSSQENYMKIPTDVKINIPGIKGEKVSGMEYVYAGHASVNKTDKKHVTLTATNIPSDDYSIKIEKKDGVTGNELYDAEFLIYYVECTSKKEIGDTGWLKRNDDGSITLLKDKYAPEKATRFKAYEDIKKLRKGTYYIYEITAPKGYNLRTSMFTNQNTSGFTQDAFGPSWSKYSDHHDWEGSPQRDMINTYGRRTIDGKNQTGKDDKKENAGKDYVLCGTQRPGEELLNYQGVNVGIDKEGNDVKNEKDKNVQITIKNYSGSLEIIKQDAKTNKKLEGAEFLIWGCEYDPTKEGGIGNKGWLKENNGIIEYLDGKNNIDNATKFKAYDLIEGLTPGAYYVFEVTAPNGYELQDQVNVDGLKKNFKPWQPKWWQINNKWDGEIGPGAQLYERYGAKPTDEKVKWLAVGNKDTNNDDVEDESYLYFGFYVGIQVQDDKTIIPKKDKISIKVNVKNQKEDYASLSIKKVNENNPNQTLEGAEFKIYGVCNDKKTAGWLNGNEEDKKGYEKFNQAKTYSDKEIKKLKLGKYYIYETKAPEGCDLREQTGYKKDPLAGTVGYDGITGEWAYLGMVELSEPNEEGKAVITTYTQVTLKEIEIIKKDAITNKELKGAKFVLFKIGENGNGWVKGNIDVAKTYTNNVNDATEYETNKDGKINIEELRNGTYDVYEIKSPDKYNLKDQVGYNKYNPESSKIKDRYERFVYVGQVNVLRSQKAAVQFKVSNKPPKVTLKGYVWEDRSIGKLGNNDHVFGDGDYKYGKVKIEDKIENYREKYGKIEVLLYEKGNNTPLAKTELDDNGQYKFESYEYAGTTRNIYESDLDNLYIAFKFNNKEFITVDPFKGDKVENNSKAIEWKPETDNLDDDKLTGNGYAWTWYSKAIDGDSQKQTLKNYLDKNEKDKDGNYVFTVKDINLGLIKKVDPEFTIKEELKYVKVKINGYTYTYNFDGDPMTYDQAVAKYGSANLLAKIHEQMKNTSVFSNLPVYPSDIAYNPTDANKKLKIYAVYSVTVSNETTTDVPFLYNEDRLYLTSLTNEFDNSKYTLCTENTGGDANITNQFALWKQSGENTAQYEPKKSGNINYVGGVFENGIGKATGDKEKTTYIQFQITDEALKDVLKGTVNLPANYTISTAKATGFHEYLRADNYWQHYTDDKRAYAEHRKALKDYEAQYSKDRPYYIHKSKKQDVQSSSVYLLLELGEQRTITGKVFEDKVSDTTLEIGDGIYDSSKENTVKEAKVDLLNVDKLTIATVYVKEGEGYQGKAAIQQTTNNKGEFKFEGMVPGNYYLRFTYGDSTQKLYDTSGNEIKDSSITSLQYKSTIINTKDSKVIQNAMEASKETLDKKQQDLLKNYNDASAQQLLQWYRFTKGTNYSTAVDNLDQRKGSYTYSIDGKIYDESGKKVVAKDINAYTPRICIGIENTNVDNAAASTAHQNTYGGFNFGIIKGGSAEMELQKSIKNIDVTTQLGNALVSGNPVKTKSSYMTVLEAIKDITTGEKIGGRSVKLEMESSLIAGSNLKVTYEVKMRYKAGTAYVEPSGDAHYGYFYKYGDKTYAHPAKATVTEIVDYIDPKYDINPLLTGEYKETKIGTKTEVGNTIKMTSSSGGGSSEQKTEEYTTLNGEKVQRKAISMTNWSEMQHQESRSVEYTVTALMSTQSNDDTAYYNAAQITKVKLEELAVLGKAMEFGGKKETEIAEVPATGENRSPIYWIAGVVSLMVIAGGIVLINKKVLK